MADNCHDCRHWVKFAEPGGTRQDIDMARGTCRRYPPVLDVVYAGREEAPETTDDDTCWIQPITTALDGCGEWESAA